jgi:hypothetical protein
MVADACRPSYMVGVGETWSQANPTWAKRETLSTKDNLKTKKGWRHGLSSRALA